MGGTCDCVGIVVVGVASVFIGNGVSPSVDGASVGPDDVLLLDIPCVVLVGSVDASVLGIGLGVSRVETELTVASWVGRWDVHWAGVWRVVLVSIGLGVSPSEDGSWIIVVVG